MKLTKMVRWDFPLRWNSYRHASNYAVRTHDRNWWKRHSFVHYFISLCFALQLRAEQHRKVSTQNIAKTKVSCRVHFGFFYSYTWLHVVGYHFFRVVIYPFLAWRAVNFGFEELWDSDNHQFIYFHVYLNVFIKDVCWDDKNWFSVTEIFMSFLIKK